MSVSARHRHRTEQGVEKHESLLDLMLRLVPGLTVRNKSVTTCSIYCKTPDGFSLRIADHSGKRTKGVERYKYKWNLGSGNQGWVKFKGVWRFYSNDPYTLAAAIRKNAGITAPMPTPTYVFKKRPGPPDFYDKYDLSSM